jgi:hypothetical protein
MSENVNYKKNIGGKMTEIKTTYINDVQAAKLMGLSRQTLANWRHKCIGPEYIKLNARCIRYELKSLERYMSQHRVIPYQESGEFG